jgi:ABC-type multidrug transport system fused ATPase/permease subunit
MFHGGGGPGPGPGHGPGPGRGPFDADEALGKVYDSKVIARLPKYLAPVKGWIAIGGGGMVLRALASLALPYLIGMAAGYIQSGDLNRLNLVVFAFIVSALLMWGGQYLETKFLAYAGQKIIFKLRTEMFDHLHRLSMSFFDRNQVGKLMSRVQNDAYQLQELLTQGIFTLITSLLTLVGIACVMLMMNPRLALICLAVVPALFVIIIVWQKYARRAFITVRRAIAVVNAQLQEGISGVRVVQSLSREEENYEQFDEVNRAHLDANVTAVRLEALMMPVVNILTGVAFGLVIVFGGYQVLGGAIEISVLVAFLLYIQRFFEPVLELTMQYTLLQRAMASGVRIFELLDVEPDIQDRPNAIEMPLVKGEVQFNRVSFGYEPGLEVLHDIDLAVRPGETVALVGRTGAGKSSLASLTARFYEVDKGEITVDGYNVQEVTQQSLRSQIGIVPQDPVLFSGSIEDNIRYGNVEACHEDVVEAAETAGAHTFINRLEHGYDAPVGQRGGNLSAGQRQLICLARAILANPHILILDEATSNVDTKTERIMQKALRRLTKRRTCLIIAHRLSTVTNANRIIVLEQGKIIETGSHQELLAKQGLYYHMFEALAPPEPAA